MSEGAFKVLKTVMLGVGPKNGGEYVTYFYQRMRQDFDKPNAQKPNVSGSARDMMESKDFYITNPMEVELVTVKIFELGLKKPKLKSMMGRLGQIGLDWCPPEAALKLLLEYYQDQPIGQSLIIGTKPIEVRGQLCIFSVNSCPCLGLQGTWLQGGIIDPGQELDPNSQFVFVKTNRVPRSLTTS